MTIHKLIGGALAATALLGMGAATVHAQSDKDTLVYVTGTDAQTLDPQMINDLPTSRIVMHIHEALVKQDENGELQPSLATSWQVSDDNLTWTFKLREDVRFHDGAPFNAAAVKFTFDRMMDPETGSPRRSALAAVEQVDVVDEHQVAIVTKKPYAPLLTQMSVYNLAIMSPAHTRAVGKDYGVNPSGTGPYKLESWQTGESLTLVRNESYWGDKPALERITMRVVPEDSARVFMLLSGEADVIASIPTVMLPRLDGSDDVNIIRRPGYRSIYLGMNLGIEPFDDQRVRRAVAHAVDPKALLDGVLNGIGTLGGSIESPVIAGAKELPNYAYDPALAKQLLAEAGFADGLDVNFYVPTGRYLMDRQIGEAVQAQLAQAGIRAQIVSPEWGAMIGALLKDKKTAQLFILGKGSPTGDPDFTMTLLLMTGERVNATNLSDPELDRMIAAQRSVVDPAEREKMLHAIQDRVYELIPHVVLFHEDQLFAARSNVEGVQVYVNEFVDFTKASKR